MRNNLLIIPVLLLLAISLKATPGRPLQQENYWVTETGPRSKPYTIIRLYDEEHKQFLEILMNGYRLRTNRQVMIKRLNRLANTAGADDAVSIGALLHIKACRVSAVKKVSEPYFAKIK